MESENIVVSLRGLSRSYREGEQARVVIDHLDLDIARGECVALLGRSGSGKSTLLNLISGIDLPTAGTIRVNGVELTALNERERTLFRRRHVGFVYQFFNLIPTLTVEENLLLPLELNGRDPDTARRAAITLLDEIGLGDRRTAYPDRLSGGEQQRVAIARALVHDPLLVLADEPTGNLDADTGRHVLALLDRLTRQAGKTLIIVTHSKAVAGLANKILTLDNGHITAQAREVAW